MFKKYKQLFLLITAMYWGLFVYTSWDFATAPTIAPAPESLATIRNLAGEEIEIFKGMPLF